MDFSTPSVKQISDLFMYLYQDLNRRPSTIDGFRTAKWNLSIVLNELTKAPSETMKDTDLKHLTLKTAFLLPLGSGKCHSEIHAWVANKVSYLDQWEKVALFPSCDFIAKNQLEKRRFSKCVAGVYSCVDYHRRQTIQRRKDPMSGAGPEVLFGSNQRPERVSNPPFHLSSWLK